MNKFLISILIILVFGQIACKQALNLLMLILLLQPVHHNTDIVEQKNIIKDNPTMAEKLENKLKLIVEEGGSRPGFKK